MYTAPFGRKPTSLENPDAPHGKIIRTRGSRQHVADWLLPNRRDARAARASRSLRRILLVLAVFGTAYLVWGAPTTRVLPIVLVGWCGASALLQERHAWLCIGPPAYLLLAMAILGFAEGGHATEDFWLNASLGLAGVALFQTCAALRIDAVTRAPAPPPPEPGRAVRIQPLHVNRRHAAVTTAGFIIGASVLFYAVLPGGAHG